MNDKVKWEYDIAYKWWYASKGTGKFAVKKVKNGWLTMRVPWFGNPEVISTHDTKSAAQSQAERLM